MLKDLQVDEASDDQKGPHEQDCAARCESGVSVAS